MVLKNSRSQLNSGATQRNIRGNTIFINGGSLYHEVEERILCSLTRNGRILEMSDTSKECVRNVLDHLGWEGLDFTSLFFKRNLPWHRGEIYHSTNKKRLWHMPERIKTMMKDAEFLKSLTPNLSLKVSHIQEIPAKKGRFSSFRERNMNSLDVIAKSSGENPNEEQPSRQRHTYHGRGVQRPHQLKKNRKIRDNIDRPEDEQQRNDREEINEELNITVFEPFHIDARCASNLYNPKKHDRHGFLTHKSVTKQKGSVNGRYAFRKGYTWQEINEELGDTLDEIHDCGNSFDKVTSKSEEILTQDIRTLRHSPVCMLSDLIKDRNVKQKKKKKRHIEEDEHLQLEEIVLHPKGSYIIVSKEQCVPVQSNDDWEIIECHDTLSSTDSNNNKHSETKSDSSVATFEKIKDAPEENDSMMQVYAQQQEKQFQKKIEAFDDSLMRVNLLVEDEEISTVYSSLAMDCEEQRKLASGHCILVANSIPPCFVVELTNHNKEDKEKPYIIGRKTGNSNMSWLVSVQGAQALQLQMKEKFQKLLENEWKTGISLTQLVEAVENLKGDLDSDKERDELLRATSSFKVKATKSDLVWQSLSQSLVPRKAIVGTVDEALSHLETRNKEKYANESNLKGCEILNENQWPGKHSQDVRECGICFLPCTFTQDENESALALRQCLHVLCVSCWRAHVYHSIRQGSFEIPCMESKCVNKLDKVTVMGILPYDLIISWQNLLRDRRIDASAVCTRCPKNGCHCVAVLTQKSKFGTLVQCKCQSCWCGSCQSVPHWPASCDQMAVYKKLLSKTRGSDTLTFSTTDYFVKLKRCPKCRYPIEKNEGCPNMYCSICGSSFCWNCLRLSSTHNVYNCKTNNDNFEQFNLQNKLVHDLPIKHFGDCVQAHQMLSKIDETLNWMRLLEKIRDGIVRPPRRFVYLANYETVIQETVNLVDQCVLFLKHAYTLQESLYVLLGFTRLSPKKSAKSYAEIVLSNMSQLNFITERLNALAVGKSLTHIHKVDKRIKVLLEAGKKVLHRLTSMAPVLQDISKDVETEWVGNIDVSKHLRYQ